jgi:Bacterial SH3 domain
MTLINYQRLITRRKAYIILLLILVISAVSFQLSAQVKVRGYYRSNGTYVQPHYRSNPDGNPYNNWSYPGNTNPYTGKTATGNPDTYLKNYYNHSSSSSSSNNYSNPSINDYSNYPYYSTYYVTANSLNVRAGPSTDYAIIGSLSFINEVQVIESYTNGWKKVQYNYLDYNSSNMSYKTGIGYVSGEYLSTSYPFLNNNYPANGYSNSINTYNSTYSTTYKTNSPYGYGNGNITIWTNCGTDGEIEIYLDGYSEGKLTKYFEDRIPACGEPGTLSINKPVGTYKLEAKGTNLKWSGTITITEDRCLIQKLEK